MVRNILALIVAAVLACGQVTAIAADNGLAGLVNSKKVIKAFVGDFTDQSGDKAVSTADFKKAVEKALLDRKSVKFELAKAPMESDVLISGVIKKYEYLKNDPITSYGGSGTFIIDAVTTENYVRMDVEFKVADPKTGGVVWQNEVTTFIKRMMTPAESIPLIYEKVSRTFLAKSFGKHR